MANNAARDYAQPDRLLTDEERYLLSQQRYISGNTAPKLQPQKKLVKQPFNKPQIIMKRTFAKKGSAPKTFLAGLSALLLLSCVIYGNVQTTEIYNQISMASKEYDVAQNENARMQSELESKMAIKNVEEYAEQVLGLQKLDQSQIEYIQIQTNDVVEIPEEEKNLFVRIRDKFMSFVEYLRG